MSCTAKRELIIQLRLVMLIYLRIQLHGESQLHSLSQQTLGSYTLTNNEANRTWKAADPTALRSPGFMADS
ncbi:hypothetical protein OPV22_004321 [Ensete ventricosum]|uniref:Uncharacterized protein n=1 Tax=Ensete ventricosum TaxID=4639 RepID=A0AAV8S331_ENSVE|nr:hypothetical protein OPV22_004321 [Ensete ventricosum]